MMDGSRRMPAEELPPSARLENGITTGAGKILALFLSFASGRP